MLSFYIINLCITTAFSYSKCDPKNYPYSGKKVSINWVAATAATKYNTPVSVTGSVNVVDGCTFSVTNLYVTSTYSPLIVYGGNGTSPDGVVLSTTGISFFANTPVNQTLTFTSTAGATVSYTDFTQFRLYDPNSMTLYATADIPAAVPNIAVSGTDQQAAQKSKSEKSSLLPYYWGWIGAIIAIALF